MRVLGWGVSAMNKRWVYRSHDAGSFMAFADQLQIDPVVSQLLLARGINGVESAKLFFREQVRGLARP